MNDTRKSVGERIIGALGGYNSKSPYEMFTLKESLKETVKLLKIKRNELKIHDRLDTSAIIRGLFTPTSDTANDKSFGHLFLSAHTQVIIEFLDCLLDRFSRAEIENRDMLIRFVYYLGKMNVLGEAFFNPHCGSSNTPDTFFHFRECKNFFFGGDISNKGKEVLSVFALRQLLEAKYKRILGVLSVDSQPSLRISSDTLPKIILALKNEIFINPKIREVSQGDLMKVYKWTNYSVHNMVTYPPWMIWKAFDIFRLMFEDGTSNDGHWSVYGGVQVSVGQLEYMRNKYLSCLRSIATKHNKKVEGKRGKAIENFTVTFTRFVEAVVFDENGVPTPFLKLREKYHYVKEGDDWKLQD